MEMKEIRSVEDGYSVVLNRMPRNSIEKITFELRLEEGERVGPRVEEWPKTEETTSAKALKKKHAWHVPGEVRSPFWQEQREQGD